MKKYLFAFTIALFSISGIYAQRQQLSLNNDWNFRFSHDVAGAGTRVDIPHTWNAVDALSGQMDYKRGIGNYTKTIQVPQAWKDKRIFIRFEGANTITNLFINGKHIGEHRGGYAAFIFELTDKLNYGEENSILVRVNNAEQLDVMPLLGDFNFYGGIYRDVYLLVMPQTCISPLDYASPGVYLAQEKVTKENASINASVVLSNMAPQTEDMQLSVKVWDGKILKKETSQDIRINGKEQKTFTLPFDIKKPHLWDGVKDPFMYQVEVSLLNKGAVIDKVIQPLGLRYYHVDPDKGFFLNGNHIKLQGVCRHQDRSEIGNALRPEHHEEDMRLMVEMGANAARLAHYPQAKYMYDLMDKNGFVVWAEIPFVGPGGYKDKGFVDQQSFKDNGKEQLIELIRQNYNHPSICFWGLFNELKEVGDNPVEYIKELNALAHAEDPTRLTASASNQDGVLNLISDVIAWNRYDGWYGGTPANLGEWLNKTHNNNKNLKIAISEYGAGGSVYHHQDELTPTNPTSMWHPENWQTYYHIENWKTLKERPFVWGSFIWNLFDFGAAHRREGDRIGVNDKGLITFDRKIKKDAFYFYKANWNSNEPTLHICEKRNLLRKTNKVDIQVFSSVKDVELFVNGKSQGKQRTDSFNTLKWENILLDKETNHIEVRAVAGKTPLVDSCVWNVENHYNWTKQMSK